MPYNLDFSKVDNVKKIQIDVSGWISPLTVEYGVSENIYALPSYCWRVEGTQHTFVIPVVRMNFIANGDYAQHFKEALAIFREDYLSWQETDTDWGREYRQQYKRFIVK